MAHSAIRYQNNTEYIQDTLLGGALRGIFITIDKKMSENPRRYGWLIEAMNKWWSDFEDMPPGLKDIELDEWVVNDERKKDFEDILKISLENVDKELTIEVMKFKEVLKQES